jgi:hypothetical protein
MKFGRKGQGAMEYLMTYGWAILVVMIVGVVLWQLGIFGGGPGAANTARGFGRIKVMEPSIKYTGSTLEFTIMNGAGQTITDLNMWVNISGPGGAGCDVVTSPPVSMDAGATAQTGWSCSAKSGGESFSVDVNVVYNITVAGTKVEHAETGTIRGSVEPI